VGVSPNTDDLRIFNRRWTPMNTDKIKASPLHPRPSASICGSILFSSCLSGRYWARRPCRPCASIGQAAAYLVGT
jgi:hypothetical protein